MSKPTTMRNINKNERPVMAPAKEEPKDETKEALVPMMQPTIAREVPNGMIFTVNLTALDIQFINEGLIEIPHKKMIGVYNRIQQQINPQIDSYFADLQKIKSNGESKEPVKSSKEKSK